MLEIKEVRELTGLSHKVLAEWLGVSKSLLQFSENGQRSLPHEAHVKLAAIMKVAQQVKNAAKPVEGSTPIINPARLAERHRKKMEFYQRSAAGLKIKLSALRRKHPRLQSRLALLEAMKNPDVAWYNASDRDQKWIEFAEWFSNDRLPRSGLEEQELLEDRIETYQAYAELHRKRWEWYEGIVGQ